VQFRFERATVARSRRPVNRPGGPGHSAAGREELAQLATIGFAPPRRG
jgi:hypothetical protein